MRKNQKSFTTSELALVLDKNIRWAAKFAATLLYPTKPNNKYYVWSLADVLAIIVADQMYMQNRDIAVARQVARDLQSRLKKFVPFIMKHEYIIEITGSRVEILPECLSQRRGDRVFNTHSLYLSIKMSLREIPSEATIE
ncbi:MAG: hypothetical protein Q8Q18_01025 [bacterium]|nr:hypothetical protein [bacterium]